MASYFITKKGGGEFCKAPNGAEKIVEASNLPAYMGAMVGRGASGATSRLTYARMIGKERNMKKVILLALITAVVLTFSALASAASNPAILTAPTSFTGSVDCSSGDCILNLSWDPLPSTAPSNMPLTQYAVEVQVNTLSTGGLSCPDTITTADYAVLPSSCGTQCTLSVDLTASGLIPTSYTLISADATVKGMIVPVKKGSRFSSNNALSATSISVSACP